MDVFRSGGSLYGISPEIPEQVITSLFQRAELPVGGLDLTQVTMLWPLQDVAHMPKPLNQGYQLHMVFLCIVCDFLHLFHGEGSRSPNLGMAGVQKFVLPFPDQHIDLIPGQIPDEAFDIFALVLVMLGIVVTGPLRNIWPVGNSHSGNIVSFLPCFQNLQQSLGPIKKASIPHSPDGQLILIYEHFISLEGCLFLE